MLEVEAHTPMLRMIASTYFFEFLLFENYDDGVGKATKWESRSSEPLLANRRSLGRLRFLCFFRLSCEWRTGLYDRRNRTVILGEVVIENLETTYSRVVVETD